VVSNKRIAKMNKCRSASKLPSLLVILASFLRTFHILVAYDVYPILLVYQRCSLSNMFFLFNPVAPLYHSPIRVNRRSMIS